MMKRITALLLALMLTLCACADKTPQAQEAAPVPQADNQAAENEKDPEIVYAEDLFAVEEVAYTVSRGEFRNFDVKVRNITDKKMPDVYYNVQALDAAGDVIESWTMGSSDALEAGQAYWYYCSNNLFDDCTSIEDAATRAESIRIVFAKVQTIKGDPSSWVQYDFRNPPTYRVAELPMRGRNMNEVIAPTEATIPTGPRVIGPAVCEGQALIIRDVSVEFMDQLPHKVTGCSAYSFSGNKEDFVLNDSQSYAAIHFTITNQTPEDIKLTDLKDYFIAELIYDGSFKYRSNGDNGTFFVSGSQSAVVYDMSSIGSVTISPLVTMDVSIYISCARQVAVNTDKILDVVFTTQYTGPETYRFAVR